MSGRLSPGTPEVDSARVASPPHDPLRRRPGDLLDLAPCLEVDLAQERYSTHPLFPKGRVRNYCTFTKVDLEARCEIERVPRRSPQRILRWRP